MMQGNIFLLLCIARTLHFVGLLIAFTFIKQLTNSIILPRSHIFLPS